MLASINTPLNKCFSINWEQMMAATSQQLSLYLTSSIRPARKGNSFKKCSLLF